MGGLTSATIWFGILQLATLILILALLYRPLGDYIAHVYQSRKDLRIERGLYRLIGVDPASAQTWQAYLRGVLVFSAMGVLFVYALQRLQAVLPYSLGLPPVPEGLAFNTAVSFVTNTNWQSYSPELTMGYTVQLAGLAVQNFVSAAVGIAVAIALVRGFAARRSDTLGNFWVDLVRGIFRLLLPLSIVAAIALLAAGVVQNFNGFTEVHTITGGTQVLPGGPVASQEAIKELGTNGGGFFNANSAHPFENPTPWTSMLEILLLLAIPFALPRAFGRIVGDNRQGYAILGVMAAIFLVSVAVLSLLEASGQGTAPAARRRRDGGQGAALRHLRLHAVRRRHHPDLDRRRELDARLVHRARRHAPDDQHDARRGRPGRHRARDCTGCWCSPSSPCSSAVCSSAARPEYLGKKIGPREIKLASLYILVTPTLVLAGTALSFALPGVRDDVESVSIWNPGVHGLSEVLYAFTSAANNNGSAFAGLTANTPWLNTALGVAMLLGRFVPIVLVLALAGSLAKQDVVPSTPARSRPTPRSSPDCSAASRSSSPHSPTSPYSRWVPWRKGSSDHVHRNSHPRVAGPVAHVDDREPAAPTAPAPSAGRRSSRRSRERCASSTRPRSGATPSCSWCGSAPRSPRRSRSPSRSLGGASESGGTPVPVGFTAGIAVWLWLTVLFANLAESVAEGRGKAQAASLRKTRTSTIAHRVDAYDGVTDAAAERAATTEVASSDLTLGDVVVVTAGELIPGDGDIVWGIATVDESAITGESAPVIRESGGDRSAVTGGTRVLSDRIVVSITSKPGETFVDRMIALVEGASRQKTPNEIALNILLASLSIVFVHRRADPQPDRVLRRRRPVSITVLVALLVCLIPTTIGALLSAIGIAGMDRLVQRNVLAMSGRAVEAAGDVTTLLLDKTGTITYGNRRASDFVRDAAASPTTNSRASRRSPPSPTPPPRAPRSSSWPRTAASASKQPARTPSSCRSPRRPA